MQSLEEGLAMINIVVAQFDIIGYHLRHSIQHTVEIRQLTVVLNLNDGRLALFAPGKYVHTIELSSSLS